MKKFQRYLVYAMSIAIFGELYFYPFSSTLRFSTAIIVLNTLILVDEEISPAMLCISAGGLVFLQRSIFSILFYSIPINEILGLHGPAVVYYVAYAGMVSLFKIVEYRDNFISTIMFLAFSDIISNILEFALRRGTFHDRILQVFILVGFLRSIISYIIFLFYKRQELFLITREGRKRYSQLNILVSSIQAEMFYLRKSTHDIENVMKKSYALYEEYKDNVDLKKKTLNIALEIHEIKKDYYRVLHGFESFLADFEDHGKMVISDMFLIIRENIYRYLKERELDIKIEFHHKDNFQIQKYYHLFTIINNLIFNSIDACDDKGRIKVIQKSDDDNIIFQVIDNGEGIEEDMLDYIFNPGFTTKFDERSGVPSTGIGLSHVQGMISELGGNISVSSQKDGETVFEIIIPKKILIGDI